ncbi:hypothetical protein H5T88_00710 [bacterium]|nr:hypothetical protein [bacterium]
MDYLLGRNPMKRGDIVDVPELVARYLVDLKVAELVKEGDKNEKSES